MIPFILYKNIIYTNSYAGDLIPTHQSSSSPRFVQFATHTFIPFPTVPRILFSSYLLSHTPAEILALHTEDPLFYSQTVMSFYSGT